MTNLYLQINIFLAASWALFQLLPKNQCNYRGVKIVAQVLLVSALAGLPLLAALPDVSFPNLSPPVKVMRWNEVDTNPGQTTLHAPGFCGCVYRRKSNAQKNQFIAVCLVLDIFPWIGDRRWKTALETGTSF